MLWLRSPIPYFIRSSSTSFMFLIPVALSRGGYTLWLHSRTPYGTHFIGLGIGELLATRSWKLKVWLKTCGSKYTTICLYLFGQFLIGCPPIHSTRQYMLVGATIIRTLPKMSLLKVFSKSRCFSSFWLSTEATFWPNDGLTDVRFSIYFFIPSK